MIIKSKYSLKDDIDAYVRLFWFKGSLIINLIFCLALIPVCYYLIDSNLSIFVVFLVVYCLWLFYAFGPGYRRRVKKFILDSLNGAPLPNSFELEINDNAIIARTDVSENKFHWRLIKAVRPYKHYIEFYGSNFLVRVEKKDIPSIEDLFTMWESAKKTYGIVETKHLFPFRYVISCGILICLGCAGFIYGAYFWPKSYVNKQLKEINKQVNELGEIVSDLQEIEAVGDEKKIQRYNRMLEKMPDNENLLDLRGMAHYDTGEYDLAIQDFTKIIRLKPNSIDAYYRRGMAYYKKNENDNAIKDLSKVIQLDESYAYAYYMRGVIYYNQGKYDEALKELNKSLTLNPKLEESYIVRGYVYYSTGNYMSASEDADTAEKLGNKVLIKYLKTQGCYFKMAEDSESIKKEEPAKNESK